LKRSNFDVVGLMGKDMEKRIELALAEMVEVDSDDDPSQFERCLHQKLKG